MFSSSLTPSKTPIDQCKDMLSEVDTMLNLVRFGSAPKKISITKKTLPTDFIKAINTLKTRVTQGVDSQASYDTSRIKLNSPSNLGPGQYFKMKLNESCKLPRHLTLKDFEGKKKSNSKLRSSINIRVKSAPKSPKEHNIIVKERMQKRIEILNVNNIRKRDRFKTQIQTQLKDSKKQYFDELRKVFLPLATFYGMNLVAKCRIEIMKVGIR